MFRLSQTSPGSFALAFVYQPQNVVNILFKSAQPDGFIVYDEETQKEMTFQNFQAIISYFNSTLRRPFLSSLPLRPWFLGEITSEEATGLLMGTAVGTYLIRFSSRVGFFAASFVDPDGQVRHVLIEDVVDEMGQEAFRIQNEDVFLPSIDDLIVYYGNTLVYPYYSGREEMDLGTLKEIVNHTYDPNLSVTMHHEIETERKNRRARSQNFVAPEPSDVVTRNAIYQSTSFLRQPLTNRDTNYLSDEDTLDNLMTQLQTN